MACLHANCKDKLVKKVLAHTKMTALLSASCCTYCMTQVFSDQCIALALLL